MRTTFFTCCDKNYEDFIPIFLHSILYNNKNVDIEIGVEDLNQDIKILNSIDYIKKIYKNSKIKLKIVNFNSIKIKNKEYKMCPNVVRFIETPTIKNDFVYICDIDIITLQKNITEIHIKDMMKTGLNYSNIVRPNSDIINRRLTGLHFTKWDSYYPIPNFEDIAKNGWLNHDEVFLYFLVKKNNIISDTNIFRPVHGIHISPNRKNPLDWGLKKWKKEWLEYRKSKDFLYIEKLFSSKLINYINKIDNFYTKGFDV